LKHQNPGLIAEAVRLWQQGKIAPDSWVIDVDQVLANGKRLLDVARQHGITLYLMTKQIGRNPWLAEKLLSLGYEGIVVVDYKESRVMRRAGLPIAHQGHLVQIPSQQVDAVAQGTDVITLFSLEKARKCLSLQSNLILSRRSCSKCMAITIFSIQARKAGFRWPA
jgi:predicted amino acid racemase